LATRMTCFGAMLARSNLPAFVELSSAESSFSMEQPSAIPLSVARSVLQQNIDD
jgi:hypothetical protein